MLSVTNSLSGGEVEAIIICCSVILVGVMIIMIVLSICGFLFKKKRLHLPPVQTISNEHTSSTNTRQQTTFHCTQTDEVNKEWIIMQMYTCPCKCIMHNAGFWLYSVYDGLWSSCHYHSKSMRWELQHMKLHCFSGSRMMVNTATFNIPQANLLQAWDLETSSNNNIELNWLFRAILISIAH